MVKSINMKSVKDQYLQHNKIEKKTPENSLYAVWSDLTGQQILSTRQGGVRSHHCASREPAVVGRLPETLHDAASRWAFAPLGDWVSSWCAVPPGPDHEVRG